MLETKMIVKGRKAFRTCDNKGFHLTFPNGVTLSTQFGWGNYCENYNFKDDDLNLLNVFKYQREHGVSSNDCEIMMLNEDGDPITEEWSKNGDIVQGQVTMEKWLSALDFARNWKK